MASAAAQGAPGVFGRRRSRPRAPLENAPQNLRGFPNHRCRGAAAASETAPASRGEEADERSELPGAAPQGRAGRAQGGVAGARAGRLGARPTLPPHSPSSAPQFDPRDSRRPRAAGAARLGR